MIPSYYALLTVMRGSQGIVLSNQFVDGGDGSFFAMFDFDEIEEKLQQQAAAANPVHTPSIDGEWEDNEGAVVIIKNQRMRGPDGVEVEVSFPRPDAVVFSPNSGAPTFEGKLTASDRISWDDGASWVRRPLSKKQAGQNGTKAANKAGAPTPNQTKTLDQKENLAGKASSAKPTGVNGKIPGGTAPGTQPTPTRSEASSKSTARVPRVLPQAERPDAAHNPPSDRGTRERASDKKVPASIPTVIPTGVSGVSSSEASSRDSAWNYERFEVMKPIVFVRESPGLNTPKVAQVTRGCVVSGRVQDAWLCLDSDSRASANVPETARGAYMLIDGRSHGLGLLLESRGCHGSSKGSFAHPLEFTALTNLHVRAKPSLSCPSAGCVAEGSQVQGYPGAESWLELVGGGFLPIATPSDKTGEVSANLESKDHLLRECTHVKITC
ncbi:rlmN [Symbiodinium natans]|uniref:RlmN protein n=1 Tax=Symbiodinium natans TaxID=878477 RepID=A0A812LVI3_9DINO|nr:rlmN [Symbiodinium natans]